MKNACIGLILTLAAVCSSQVQAQTWEATSGPLGGSARSISTSPSGDLFVSNLSSIFRSSDDGTEWIRTPGTPGTTFMTRLLVSPDSGHIFVGSTNVGLYKSTDAGATWDRLNNGLAATNIQDIQPGLDGDLIIGSDGGGFFRSSDGGASWTDMNEDLADLRAFAAAQANNGDLYAGTIQTGVYRRDAGASTWTAISDGLGNMRCTWLLPSGDNEMYAGTGGGVFRIAAGETEWTPVGPSIGFVSSLFRNEAGVLFATTLNGVRRYDEGGDSWDAIDEGVTNPRTWQLTENDAGTLFMVSDAGIFRSEDDGDSWTYQVDGYRVASVQQLLTLDDGTLLAGTEENGVFRSDDTGLTWERSDEGLSNFAMRAMVLDANGVVFAGISGLSGVARSSDGGRTWDDTRNGFVGSNVMALASSDARTYASPSTGEVVFFTEDGGDSWEALPDSGMSDYDIRALAATSDDAVVYAGTQRDGILRLVQPDTIWTLVGQDLPGAFTRSLAVNDDGGLFVATNAGLHFSSDNGDSWTELDHGLASNSINFVTVTSDRLLLIGTTAGAAVSGDYGATWVALDMGLDVSNVLAVTRQGDAGLYAGTDGDGVYRTSLLITSTEDPAEQVSGFELTQNYPNPFNPTTTIGFTLERSAAVELSVFDVLGRRVKTLVDTRLPAGTHSTRWDGLDAAGHPVASGTYVYRLRSGDHAETRTLVLLR